MLVPLSAGGAAFAALTNRDIRRCARSLYGSVENVALFAITSYEAISSGDKAVCVRAVSHLGHVPLDLVDATVYAASSILPFVPAGDIWALVRGQD